MTSPLALVLSRLPDAKRRGTSYVARCPSHEDGDPSLSITEALDGRVLLHCHAGCGFRAIVAALSLTVADLHTGSRGQPFQLRSQVIAEYRYVDENDGLLFVVERLAAKGFRQKKPNDQGTWIYKLDDTRRVLYRLPEVIEAASLDRPVLIVEGEKDVETARQLGWTATCNPGGAGKWRDEYAEALSGADVCVIPDGDGPGEAHALTVAQSCGEAGCRVRLLRLPAPSKDLTAWMEAGGTSSHLAALMEGAPEFSSLASQEPVYRARTLAELLLNPEMMKAPEPVVSSVVFRGRVTLLAAREKTGKSTFASAGVAAYSRGQSFLNGEPATPGIALWISLEEADADLAQRLVAFDADPERVLVATNVEIAGVSDIAYEAKQPGIGLIVIDSLSKLADLEGIDEGGNAAKWSPLMTALTRIARDTTAGILLIHHGRKDGGYRDSTAIGAGVDIIYEVADGPVTDPMLRLFTPKGRIRLWPFSARLSGTRYILAPEALSLPEKIIGCIGASPGLTWNAVVDLVREKREKVLAEGKRLLQQRAIENRGSERKASLWVAGASWSDHAARPAASTSQLRSDNGSTPPSPDIENGNRSGVNSQPHSNGALHGDEPTVELGTR